MARGKKKQTPGITIDLNQEEIEGLTALAKTRGVSLEEFAKNLIQTRIPSKTPPVEAKVEAAPTPVVAAPAPAPTPPAPKVEEKKEPPAAAPVDKRLLHPCIHNRQEWVGNNTPNTSAGTCASPKQRGRPCYFTGPAASSCPAFSPYAMFRRSPLTR